MAVLEAPEEMFAPERVAARRMRVVPKRAARREFEDEFGEEFAEGGEDQGSKRGGVKVRFRLGIPRTKLGWGLLAALVLSVGGIAVAGALAMQRWALADDRFVIPSSSAVEIQGNQHLTRAQLLSIFGGDVERNIFSIPLEDRKADLEQLPWVERATVMRLLPDHLRIGIVERTPVAFVREGGQIGLVDASGVLLDMPVEGGGKYSFPVVTGITAADPLSTRTARMKIYRAFTSDLDSNGEKISEKLSEVDLSNPEDVKALIPDHEAEVLVHFGDTDFLTRYKKFEELLPTWRAQYPKLASVDMRYERQAVLEMEPGSAVPVAGAGATDGLGAEQEALGHSGAAVKAPVAARAKVVARVKVVPKKPVVAKKQRRSPAPEAKMKAAQAAALRAKAHPIAAKKKVGSNATKVGAAGAGAGSGKYRGGQAVQR